MDWVFNVRWDYRPDGNGYVEIWQDNVKKPTYNGPNWYNDKREMYLKTGIYKINGWKDGLTNRVLYMDEVKMGNEQCTYGKIATTSR